MTRSLQRWNFGAGGPRLAARNKGGCRFPRGGPQPGSACGHREPSTEHSEPLKKTTVATERRTGLQLRFDAASARSPRSPSWRLDIRGCHRVPMVAPFFCSDNLESLNERN
jgi:hypothetical protein